MVPVVKKTTNFGNLKINDIFFFKLAFKSEKNFFWLDPAKIFHIREIIGNSGGGGKKHMGPLWFNLISSPRGIKGKRKGGSLCFFSDF